MKERLFQDSSSEISQAINAASLGKAAWGDVCTRILDFFPGSYAAILNQKAGTESFNFIVADGIEDNFLNSYLTYYAAKNPWRGFWQSARSGSILVLERDEPARLYREQEFYSDWMRPMGDYDAAVGLRLQFAQDEMIYFPIHYPTRLSPAYDEVLERVMKEITASLTNAYQLSSLMRQSSERQSAAVALVDRNADIALVIDEHLKVLDANNRANVAFKTGYPVACRWGKLRFADPRAEQQLTEWFRTFRTENQNGNMRFTFANETDRWLCSMNQLPSMVLPGLAGARPQFLCQLKQVSGTHHPDAKLLASSYHLTPAETALCLSLAAGLTLEKAAARNDVSYENARQKLKSIFRKTGVNNQVDLSVILRNF